MFYVISFWWFCPHLLLFFVKHVNIFKLRHETTTDSLLFFRLLISLPFPWLLYNIINDFKPVEVSSNGLFCAIVLLFLMLLFVIISIAACKWRMSKLLGFLMFMLYFVFLIVSVMLEDKIIICPITI